MQKIKILSKKSIPKSDVHDIEVEGEHHYILESGIISHNSGQIYNSDIILMLSKKQHKEGTKVTGNIITSKCDKNRDMKNKTKVFTLLHYEKGLHRHFGMLDYMIETKIMTKTGPGKYCYTDDPDVIWSEKQIYGSKKEEVFTEDRLKEFDEKVAKLFRFGTEYFDDEDEDISNIIDNVDEEIDEVEVKE